MCEIVIVSFFKLIELHTVKFIYEMKKYLGFILT